MSNYAPELSKTSEDIRQLTEEVYPTVDLSNSEEIDTYDELLGEAQIANESALAPVIEARNNEVKQIEVKKLGELSAKAAIEEARIARDAAAAQTINESVASAYDNYRR